MKKVVNKPLTDKTFKAAVIICLEHDPANGLYNLEPYGKMPDWDVSQVTDMSYAFDDASSFNGNISKWNVSSVTDMGSMFYNASSFNQDLSKWNVSSVIYMNWMFDNAASFNQDLSKWDVSSVVNKEYIFNGALALKLPKPNFINAYK